MDGKKRSSLGAASFWRGAVACCVILLSVFLFVFGLSSHKTAWAAPEDDDGVSIELFDYSALDDGERLPQQQGGNKRVDSVNSATNFRKNGTKYAAFHFQYNQIDGNSDYGCTYKMNGGNGNFNAPWQTWASGKGPTQGVVKDTLGDDGLPVFGTLVSNQSENMRDRSLSYLFTSSDYAVAYTNVNAVDDEGTHNGLLYKEQTDNGSHYYFDSKDTFAEFDISTGNFKKYNNPNGDSPASEPRFLPFDKLDEVTLNEANSEGGYLNKDEVNYSFGMKMTVDFLQPAGGKVGNENMQFKFNGDDDVWVFIDDVLVLDIGGIHDAKGGWIDFATGQVHVDGNSGTAGDSSHDTTLKKLFTDAGVNNLDDLFNEDGTFKDYTTHKLSFFYLERGAGGSNCQIDFNLQTIPEGTINIGKNVDYANVNNVSDLDFTFKAYVDSDGDATDRDECSLFTGKYDIYELGSNRLIEEGVQTSADGTITLKHGQYARISDGVAENSKYYVIETGVTSDTYEVTLAGTSQKLETVTGDGETVIGVRTPLLTVSDMAFVTFNNTVQADNAFNVEIKKEGSVVDGDTFYVLTMIGSKKYTGEYTVYDSDDAVSGTTKTANDGIIELKAGQHAEIVGIVGGNTVSVYEVNENGTPFSDEMYREPTFSMENKTTGGTVLQGAPTALNDDNGKGIKGETNEGKALGENPTLLAKITNKLVAEPVQPELHKYVDDNEDGTYDLSLDVHGAIGASQADPTEVDIVYILDLSYSMMWTMDGDEKNDDNPSGDIQNYEYSFDRYEAAISAINTLNNELAANEGLDVQAALVTFAPTTLKTTNFVSADSFSDTLPAAQWSTFDSGTNYGAALNSAKSVLESSREDAKKVVIFISDGEPNRDGLNASDSGNPEESTQFAEQQVRDLVCDSFYTIGVGSDNYERYLKRVVNAADSAKSKQYFASSNSDALSEYFESIASAITAVDCTNVVITDKLSNYAELTDDATFNVTITKGDHGGESVAVTGGSVNIEDAKNGATLTFQSGDGETQTLTLTYDENTKTFTLAFPQNYALEAGWTYTITTQIQPTEEARNYYLEHGVSPETGDPETDVPGTPENEWISSGKPGFHSNHKATLSYTSAKQDKVDEYPNPVIQANQLTIKDVLKVTKTLNGHPLDEGMFDFTVEPKAWDNGKEGDEKVEVTAQQAASKADLTLDGATYTYENEGTAQSGVAGLVRMGNEIAFTTDDIGKTYVYEYAELGHLNEDYPDGLGENEITNNDVLFDSTQYKVELSVSEDNGQLQVTMTKFSRESESDQWTSVESKVIESSNCDCTEGQPLMSIAFENTAVMPQSITYAVSVAKVLEGAGLENNMFEFSIEARKTGTGESEVTAAEAAARASLMDNPYVFDNGTALAGEGIDGLRGMRFTAADATAGKVFEYLFTEKGMSDNYKGTYERGDFVYDETKYLLQFRPTLVETPGGAELVVELWQAESNADTGSFSELEKVGSYVANGFHSNLSDGQGREAQAEYTLTFTNKLKPLGLQIVKIEKNTTTRLPYAYFSLEDGEGNKVSAYSASDPTEENKLGADEQATNDQGILYFYGLEDGKTYTLTETKFPSGYQAESEDGVSFQIKVDNGIVSVKNGENEWAPLDPARANGDPNDQNSELVDHCFYIQVSNVKLPDIPASGSNGTLLMMSTGFAAIVLAGTYLSKRFGHLWN